MFIQQHGLTHFAAATILTGVTVTLVDFSLAVVASKPRSAGAGVAALASVGAWGIILAWLVVGAVIQVWS